jgi:SAM-dependent methyltransferase
MEDFFFLAGFGLSIQYFDRTRVSRYIALEPNDLMHNHIRAKANEAGFHESDGTLIILSFGAQDTHSILSSLSQEPVDTILSVLTLCSIPDPQHTILKLIRDLLKPGGQLLYIEHVLSTRPDVAWWQRFWAPLWACAFDGCRMDRPSDVWIHDLKIGGGGSGYEGSDAWSEWKFYDYPDEDEEDMFVHSLGKFVKI